MNAGTSRNAEVTPTTRWEADWWRSGVVYQIYPRSFADGNSDGVGDIAGITSRLPYLHKLGVDAVWLNPWYLSPLADGGYDVADYRQIDPRFGSLQDAEDLIKKAADMGIRVIVDIVPNHVSDQHPWFKAALASEPGSEERSRFWFHDGRDGDPTHMPTNWLSSFRGNTWTRTTNADGSPGQWYLHLFTPEQPDLNWNHPEVRTEHEEILKFWFDRGAAGVRVDSAVLIIKDPSLPDDPTLLDNPPPDASQPFVDLDEIHEVYQSWRTIADSYDPPRIIVGEVWLPDTNRFAAYLGSNEMHTAFNFDFMTRAWDPSELHSSITATLAAHAPVNAPATWVLSNHDVTRPVTRYGRTDTSFAFEKKRFGTPTDLVLGTRRARAAFLLCAALPGSLYIYQGDELGLPENEELPREVIEDPMYFRSEGVDPGRDGCRVPLPWEDDPKSNYGFSSEASSEQPWMPQPAWWGEYAVSRQEEDPQSMLWFYREALRLRREIEDFHGNDFEWCEDLPESCLGFRRGKVMCIVNFGQHEVPLLDLPILFSSEPVADSIGSDIAVWFTHRSTGEAGPKNKGV
ncbi:MAG: glycoside hydrolase family 13 protein [Propionibacteriaceae bacterium]|jgi:alpha-glucosidase|nr:glycoside hydrolase family 13 protein [Propionibacteriaceae bacterium]